MTYLEQLDQLAIEFLRKMKGVEFDANQGDIKTFAVRAYQQAYWFLQAREDIITGVALCMYTNIDTTDLGIIKRYIETNNFKKEQ